MTLSEKASVEQPGALPGRSALVHQLAEDLSRTGIRQRKRRRLRYSLAWLALNHLGNALRRTANVLFAVLLLLLLSPVLLLLLLIARRSGGGLRQEQRLGRWGTHFPHYELVFPPTSVLSRFTPLRSLPALWNILRGDMTFIGPRPVSPTEKSTYEPEAWRRYDLRPGLLSLWWLRKRANMAYASETSLDLEYVETRSVRGDLGIAARALPAFFLGVGGSSAPPQLNFLGVRIDNFTMAEAAEHIIALTRKPTVTQLCFVNADCINIAFNDKPYRQVLHRAELVLADGIGVRLAGSILNQNVRENVNGTDMFPRLCCAAEEAGTGIYLLGGRPGVADAVAAWMTVSFPRIRVSGFHHGFFTPDQQPHILDDIRASGAEILLVALGAPLQDKWIAQHKHATGARVCIGVGGLLDFYSGRIRRAPTWVRELGIEWFFRFIQEPRRMWRRYFVGNGIFLYHVFRERLSGSPFAAEEDVAA